jgi:hypothetical protein
MPSSIKLKDLPGLEQSTSTNESSKWSFAVDICCQLWLSVQPARTYCVQHPSRLCRTCQNSIRISASVCTVYRVVRPRGCIVMERPSYKGCKEARRQLVRSISVGKEGSTSLMLGAPHYAVSLTGSVDRHRAVCPPSLLRRCRSDSLVSSLEKGIETHATFQSMDSNWFPFTVLTVTRLSLGSRSKQGQAYQPPNSTYLCIVRMV